jgi:hypothetical protein
MVTAAWNTLAPMKFSRRNAAAATISTLFFIQTFAQSANHNGIMWLFGFPKDGANA